jgi:hypothetical protein
MDLYSFDQRDQGQEKLSVLQDTDSKPKTGMIVVDIWNNDFEDFGRLTYEELAVTIEEEDTVEDRFIVNTATLDTNTVMTRSRAKKGQTNVQELLQEHQRKEAKFTKAKHTKPATIVQEVNDIDCPSDTNMDRLSEQVEEAGQGSEPILKAVRFLDRQNELSEPPAIAGSSVKSRDRLSEPLAITGSSVRSHDPGSNNIQRKGSYKGLMSVYRAREILLDHFTNSKLDITVI